MLLDVRRRRCREWDIIEVDLVVRIVDRRLARIKGVEAIFLV
jgi:hypothetical protein